MKAPFKIIMLALVLALSSFAADWIPVSKPGQFKVLFPRQPKETAQPVEAAGYKFQMKMLMYEVGNFKDDNLAYALYYSDMPAKLVHSDFKDEILNGFFDGAIGNAVSTIKGTKLSEEKITINDYPGREVKVSFADSAGLLRMKIYLVKSRMYMLQVTYETEKDNNAAIDKFFSSFALLSK